MVYYTTMKNIFFLFCTVALAAQGIDHTVTFRRLNGTVLSRVEVARSADWIKATYDTAASASFAAYGAVRSNSKGFCIIVR